jgi:hypothetical protein
VLWVVVGIVVGVVVAVGALAVIVREVSARSDVVDQPPSRVLEPARSPRPPDTPMTGLESALAQVTDRDGRPIGDRLDAESHHVDDLRVPDDTGPLLRRALDHVEQREPDPEPSPPVTGESAAPA